MSRFERKRPARVFEIAATSLVLFGIGCNHPASRLEERSSASERSLEQTPDLVGHYGLGRAPSEEEIAAWDLDVRPDGEGLPEGSGTAAAGRLLYASRCQKCHGADGTGGPFDPLVGRSPDDAFPFALDPRAKRTIGRYWPYATTIFDYTRRAMPQDRPGSLGDDEVYALTAYLLYMNGLFGEEETLDRRNLPEIIMPARDRFVPDDRQGGPGFR